MRNFNFTVRAIESLPIPADRRAVYHDTQVPELGLMIQPTGHRSYFWFRKIRTTPTWKTIGTVEELSIEQARGAAQGYSADLARWKLTGYKGPSPFGKRAAEPTLGELLDDFIERHVLRNAKRPEDAAKRTRQAFTRDFGSWKNRKLSAVTRKDVLDRHAEIGATRKFLANRAVRFLSKLFNFAKDTEVFDGPNPATRVKLYREAPRTRFLAPEELARLFAALRKEPNPDLTDAVNLLLWTGARKSDVFSMRWSDVRLDDTSWTVPDPKNRRPYVVPLTPEAVKILRARLKDRTSTTWVFPSHGKSGHLVDLKGRWKELLKRANIGGFRMHDLRRTQGSWQAGAGVPLQVIGKALGHQSLSSTQVYSVLQLDPVREAMTAANAAMKAASKRKVKLLPEETHA